MQIGSSESLRLIFRQALTAVLTAGSSIAVGCGGDPPDPPGLDTEPGFVSVDCSNGRLWLTDLKPEPAVDYLELRRAHAAFDIIEQFGIPCATLADRSKCEAALANTDPYDGFYLGPLGRAFVHLRATRADNLLKAYTRDKVTAFLRPIDTHGEAVLLGQIANIDVSCDRGGSLETPTGYKVQGFQWTGCGGGRVRVILAVTRDGVVSEVSRYTEVETNPNCVVGRRPAGLCRPNRRPNSRTIGGYFAEAARLEAASVVAFERLRAELRAHGAPGALRRAAHASARDEIKHARRVGALALRFGTEPEAPRVPAAAIRDLEDIAVENATEGCVGETFGALVGRWQAFFAADREVRSVYRAIAEDELRHAALAWRVARWIEPRLTDLGRRRVLEARREAVFKLQAELAVEPSREIRRVAGVPGADDAGALARHLVASLGLA